MTHFGAPLFDLIPCPPAGACRQLSMLDEKTASRDEMKAAVNAALDLLEKRPRLLVYIVKLECWPSKD